MQNLFLTEDDVFEVAIFVAKNERGLLVVDIEEAGVKILLGDEDAEVEKYTAIFKKPSFGDLMSLTEILLSPRELSNGELTYDINPIAAKIKTMAFLIKDWSLTYGDGQKMPPTEQNIGKLNPIIATAISLQLDDYLQEKEAEEVKEEKTE